MRAAARDPHLLYRVASAGFAGLPVSVIHSQMVEIAAGIAVDIAESFGIEGRTVVGDATRDYPDDRLSEACNVAVRERTDGCVRVDAGAVQRFVYVDIAEPCDAPLVEQCCLDDKFR